MKRLVVNADDYNLTKGCDRAIEECMAGGAITSASCLVWSWDRPPVLTTVMHGRTGLHLRLTNGHPVAPLSAVPSLVDKKGYLPSSRSDVAARNMEVEEVEAEWYEQRRRFGQRPTHIDSHHHCHSIPGIDRVYEELCEQTACAGVPLHAAQRDRLRACGVRCASLTEIRWTDGKLATLQRLLTEDFVQAKTVHLMTHPGFVDEDLRRMSGMVDVRRWEFATLRDVAFARWLDSEGIEKIGMADL